GWEGGRGSRFLRHGIPARGSRRGTGSGSRARRSNRTYASLSSVPLVIVVAIPLLVTWVAIAWVPVARIGIARSRLLLRLRLLLLPPPEEAAPCLRPGRLRLRLPGPSPPFEYRRHSLLARLQRCP